MPTKFVYITLLALLSSIITTSANASKSDHKPELITAWLQLAQHSDGRSVGIARTIQKHGSGDCPTLVAVGGTIHTHGSGNCPMPVAVGGTAAATITLQARDNPDHKHFPIQVCEGLVAKRQSYCVAGTTLTLPSWDKPLERLVVLGDSGCDGSKQGDCAPNAWPFAAIASQAAADHPDLILHVGDYNYRGTPGHVHPAGHKKDRVAVYDAGDNAPNGVCKLNSPYYGQNSPGYKPVDHWKNWWLDLFQPAAPLLQAAPWVFARGNHELCSRGGPGWMYLLDNGSSLLGDDPAFGQRSCPQPSAASSREPLKFTPPYRLDLPNLTLLALDSANACDSGDLHQAHYDDQFKQLQALVDAKPTAAQTWLLSHRPLWGVEKSGDGRACRSKDHHKDYGCVTVTTQQALRQTTLTSKLSLSLSGHMHRFQALGFSAASGRPAQLIVGNSGVTLASNHPDKTPFEVDIDGHTGRGFGLSKFGYLDLQFDAASPPGWHATLWSPNGSTGAPLALCGSTASGANGICDPAQ